MCRTLLKYKTTSRLEQKRVFQQRRRLDKCFRYYSIKSEDCKRAGGGKEVGDNSVDNVDNVNKRKVRKCKSV